MKSKCLPRKINLKNVTQARNIYFVKITFAI